MRQISRRQLLQSSAAIGATAIAPRLIQAEPAAGLLIAPFRFDVTPPVGHPLCGVPALLASQCAEGAAAGMQLYVPVTR